MASWKKLPNDIQDIIQQNLTEAATLQREDWIRITEDVTKTLKDHGMVFNTPDVEPFRKMARDNGFYIDVKKKMGDEVWALLEKYTGPLV